MWEQLSRGFRDYLERPANPWIVGGILLLALGGILWAVYAATMRPRAAERRLFDLLGADSGLTDEEVRLLWRAALEVAPQDPVEIFLSPRLWESAGQRLGLPGPRRDAVAGKLYR